VSLSSEESSDAYEQERPSKQKRPPKRRTDGRQAQKKRKRKQVTEEDLNDLPPDKGPSSRRPIDVSETLSQRTSFGSTCSSTPY
jgi:hypothetical protein